MHSVHHSYLIHSLDLFVYLSCFYNVKTILLIIANRWWLKFPSPHQWLCFIATLYPNLLLLLLVMSLLRVICELQVQIFIDVMHLAPSLGINLNGPPCSWTYAAILMLLVLVEPCWMVLHAHNSAWTYIIIYCLNSTFNYFFKKHLHIQNRSLVPKDYFSNYPSKLLYPEGTVFLQIYKVNINMITKKKIQKCSYIY